MAKQQKHSINKPPVRAKVLPKEKVQKNTNSTSLFVFIENHFVRQTNKYLLLILSLSVFLGILCFDLKLTYNGDDAGYIEAGTNYANNFFKYFYLNNAPLYPIVLSFIIKLIGVNLLVLKLFSLLCFVLFLLITYKGLEKTIPYIILIPTLLIIAVNFPMLMFASSTFTESFSLFIYSISLYFIINALRESLNNDLDFKRNLFLGFVIATCCFLMTITRSVALGTILIVAVFLLFYKRYHLAGIAVVIFGAYQFLYKLALKIIWGISGSQFATQTEGMLVKDPYDFSKGNEDVAGMIKRFFENCDVYISSRFYYVLGFRDESSPVNHIITILTIMMIVISVWFMYKKRDYVLLFLSLFFSGLLAVTFISLPVVWGQSRLVMVFLPYILFNFFYLLYYLGSTYSFAQVIYPFFIFVLLLKNISVTTMMAKETFPTFLENLQGNETYGYTTDWQNYFKMSKYCADSLPANSLIACRKPSISYIFTGKNKFYGIFRTNTTNPDSLLMPLKAAKVTHIFTAELRADPNNYVEGQIIGTVHRFMYYVAQKYPYAFQKIHVEGDLEKAELYSIDYPVLTTDSIAKPN